MEIYLRQILSLAYLVLLAQSHQSAVAQNPSILVVERTFSVDWVDSCEAAPVGLMCTEDGFWLDEIPWGVYEIALPENWSSSQILVDTENWQVVEASTLTNRQQQICLNSDAEGQWKPLQAAHLMQWTGPLLRWNSIAMEFERLDRLDLAVGRSNELSGPGVVLNSGERARTWPDESPLESGLMKRISIPSDGIYAIDKTWMMAAGLEPDTLDTRHIHIYGNGGRMLPMENSTDRPLGVQVVASWFPGGEDGSWDDGDVLYFWGQGPHDIAFDGASNEWSHERHAYEDVAWYFLCVDREEEEGRISYAAPESLAPDTTINRYWNVQFHELELESPNRSGREWFGESFGTVNQRLLSFNTPFATDQPAKISARVAAQSMGAASSFGINSGDVSLVASPSYTSETSTSNVANLASVSGTGMAANSTGVDAENARLDVTVTFNPAVSGAVGWLDFVRIEQECHLKMSQSSLAFIAPATGSMDVAEYVLAGGQEDVQVWDITQPSQPEQLEITFDGEFVRWTSRADSLARFVAFHGTNFPAPQFIGDVQPTNLHAVTQADLVIVTRPAYMEAAQELAQLHADEGLHVLLTTQRAVFDEFSSGSVDPTAVKMLMMMLRDKALIGGWQVPKYLQLFGDGTFANRQNLEASPYVITYQSENSVSPTGSYVSDDYFGFLEDQYGEGIGDKLAIGVGRIPCSSATEAQAMVDKIKAYRKHPSAQVAASGCLDESGGDSGTWRNRICLVSDDMDGNGGPTEIEHMVHSDEHATTLAENHPEYNVTKIYLDAYPQESTPGGERYPDAQQAIDRQVRDGSLIVNYIGHGGERGWSHERVLNTTTIQEWENIERMPLFMTATCELARFDDPEVDSAGEMMVLNPKGGAIAMLTTTRVVFSGSNQQLNRAFYAIALQDTGATPLRLGDIARVTKNDPQVSNSSNKRNFSLLGDVALELNYPEHEVRFTDLPDTLRALESARVGGFISNQSGDTLNDFNGIIHVEVFDKRSQITSLNNDNAPNPHTFQVYRNVLFRGVASVANGAFEFEFIVPRDIDYTFGNGRISAYAVSDSTDANGAVESIVIGGVASDFMVDMTPPEVHLFLNDTNFVSGGMTDEDPWLLARVFDEGGINASGVGIGHDIKATLDGQSDESLVLNDFYTTDLNTFQSGTVRYPFETLEEGAHSLSLVVWDVQNNKGEASVDFIVASSLEAAFGEVLAFPNPSSSGFNFSIAHNQSCKEGQMVLEVFSSMGRLVHRVEVPWHEEGFRATGMRWDAPVAAGVYVFRITLIPEVGAPAQYSDQLVVIRP